MSQQSPEYFAILTAIGEAKDADAKAGGVPLKLTHMVVGDGAGTTPSPELAQTQLVREVYRAPLNQLSLDPINTSQVIAECVIPEKNGGWWIREVGLLDADGDLVAVANCPPSYKPQMPEGSARTQVIRMVLIVSSAETVQLSIDPGIVMATRDYADSAIARAEFTPVGGTVPIRVEEKLKQTVSMLDLGGAGNFNMTSGTGTNNFQRLIDHVRAYNDCPVVHFPFVTGETNVYYFQYKTPYTFGNSSLKISADKGVVFYCDNVSFDCESNETVIAKSPFKMGMSYLDKGDTTFPQPLNKKSRFIGHGDLVKPMVRAVNPAQEFHTQVLLWPGTVDTGGSDAEVLAASANVALHDTAIVFDSAAGSGVFEGGGMRLRAGQRLSARVAIPAGMANFRSCVFGRTATGYYGISSAGGRVAVYEKEAGSPSVSSGWQQPQDSYRQTHQSFDMDLATVTIALLDAFTFQILVNGALFYYKRTKEPIQDVMFGGYLAGSVSNCIWSDFYLQEGAEQSSTDLIGLFYIGDSRQSDGASCPARYCAQYIDGSLGARVIQYNNQAVGGHDSSAQLGILRQRGIPPGTTDVVIAWGTNDAQGLVSVATLYANTKEAVRLAKEANAHVVIDVFPLWYTQGQAGPRGQASLNYASATPYRMALLKVAAEEGVPVVDGLSEYGLLIANMVNPLLKPDLTKFDPVIADNIHGNPTLAKLQGHAHAKTILAQRNVVSHNRVDWRAIPAVWTMQNSYTVADGSQAKYRVNDCGDVEFTCKYKIGSSRENGTVVQYFGRLLTPKNDLQFHVSTEKFESGYAVLGTDGVLKIYGLAASTGSTIFANSRLYATA